MLNTRLQLTIAAIAALLVLSPVTAQAQNRSHHHAKQHRATKHRAVQRRATPRRAVVAMAASDCIGADLPPSPANVDAIRTATLCLLNVERTQRGRVALRSNGNLGQAAGLYATTMVSNNFFAHVSPSGSTFVSRIKRTNYLAKNNGWALGENLAWGEAELATPASIVKAWMLSPEHKRNILDGRYVEIGVGVAFGTPNSNDPLPGLTYATEFGTRTLITPA
jgi:uncharacterized protein YkwD